VGKAPGADALAEMGDGGRVAEKVLEAHGSSLVHFGAATQAGIPGLRIETPSASLRAGFRWLWQRADRRGLR
jgi:hypothetical protein